MKIGDLISRRQPSWDIGEDEIDYADFDCTGMIGGGSMSVWQFETMTLEQHMEHLRTRIYEPTVVRTSGAKKCNAILTYGEISALAIEAWDKITAPKEHVPTDVIVFPDDRPFDTEFLSDAMKAYQCVVVVEDHDFRGGLAELASIVGKVACSFGGYPRRPTVNEIVGVVR